MFAHGQLYVALSRVSRWSNLRLWQYNEGDKDHHTGIHEVVNPVLKSILA